jgi:glucan 1,3-beta-glucosidase
VYQGAWTRITNAIALAAKYDLGVLLGKFKSSAELDCTNQRPDLHAAPGKQNNDAHAGAPGPAQFLKHKKNMKNTTNILKILLQQVSSFARSHSLDNVVGIELINEPASDGQHEALEAWYVDTIRELRTIDATIPLVIGDSWWTDHYAEFIHKAGLPGVILDHHLYRCFTEGDGKKGAAQHAHELTDPQNGAVKGLGAAADKLAESGGALIVGEWSAALNPGSLPGGGQQVELKRQYVDAELALFERVCAGWFYWTYKKEGGKDTGWCWRDAVEEGVFTSNFGMKASSTANVRDDQARAGRRDQVGQKALGKKITLFLGVGADM